MSTLPSLDDSTQPLTTEDWAHLLGGYATQLAPHLRNLLLLPTLGVAVSFLRTVGGNDRMFLAQCTTSIQRVPSDPRANAGPCLEHGFNEAGIFEELPLSSPPNGSGTAHMQVWGFTRHGHWVLIDITVLRRLSLPDTYEYPGAIQAQNVTPLVILEKTGADPRRMLEQLDDMARIARYQVARNLKLLQELTDRKFGIWAAVAARESKQG